MKKTANTLIHPLVVLLTASLAACSTTSPTQTAPVTAAMEQVQELAPGFLQGYLTEQDQLDMVVSVRASSARPAAAFGMSAASAIASIRSDLFIDPPFIKLATSSP